MFGKWSEAEDAAPLPKHINDMVLARLEFLEAELRKKHIYLVCGVEQKFHVSPYRQGAKGINVLQTIRDTLRKGTPRFLESVDDETTQHKYEIKLGTPRAGIGSIESLPTSVSRAIAEEAQKARDLLRECFAAYGYRVSFSAAEDFTNKSTAGLHIQISAMDRQQKNLFFDINDKPEESLRRACADELVALQKQGMILYAPTPRSYERYEKNNVTPAKFAVGFQKNCSVMLKPAEQDDPGDSQFYRIEDRLAGANASPALILLAAVGALYSAICKPSGRQVPAVSSPIVTSKSHHRIHQDALTAFAQSDLWREVAGAELHTALVEYLRGQKREPRHP